MPTKSLFIAMILISVLSACSAPTVQRELDAVEVGAVIDSQPFSNPHRWESNQFEAISVGMDGESYRIQTDINHYVRGFYQGNFTDVILDVRAVQLTNGKHNGFGVACRASHDSTSSNGYYFLISGDGAYSIRRGHDGDLHPLIAWEKHRAIRPLEVNQLRVVCIGDYLALSVNGELIAEARDTTFTQGRIGFTATTRQSESLEVLFSDLTISEGSLSVP
jgi:hypothetical protein